MNGIMGNTREIAYCEHCKKEIKKPKKEPMDEMHKSIWIISFICTLGFSAIPFLIYNKFYRKREICPECGYIVTFKERPALPSKEKEEEEKSKKEELLEKAEEMGNASKSQTAMEPVKEDKFCEFCGKSIEPGTKRCPYCNSPILD